VDLQYAPPAKSPNRVYPVIVAGLLTTALALLGVYMLEVKGETNVMGWHANYVIPAGAILVGLVASSGYGIASYVTGLKIRKGLLWLILLLQVGAYFGAEYVTFLSRGPLFIVGSVHQLTFPEYFNFTATHFAWKKENGKGTEEPLGEAGYIFIMLEILGFAGGSLIVPGVLMKQPYCELCQMYMKSKRLATLPASIPARKIKKKDAAATQAYNDEQKQAYDISRAKLAYFAELSVAGDAIALRQNMDALLPGNKAAHKLPARISITLVRCRGCNTGHLQPALVTGQGKQVKSINLPRQEWTRELIQEFASLK
jgi:hypothetical protein